MSIYKVVLFIYFVCLNTNLLSVAQHGISLYGYESLKYKKDFECFKYVNKNAPKGGEIRIGVIGTYNSLNAYVTKGIPAKGTGVIGPNLLFDTLMKRSADESFSLYGLIAESVEIATDRSWMIVNIRPSAVWDDGKPITASDVKFSHQLLRDKSRPHMRLHYSKVLKTEILGKRKIKFIFKKTESGNYDYELPLIMCIMTILPEHILKDKDFEKTVNDIFIGSGPYKVESFKMGHSITYKRKENYWGKDLAVNVGMNNFDIIRYDYYRNKNAAFEAFKAAEFDYIIEADPKKWLDIYNFPAVKKGLIKKIEIIHKKPVGMRGFVFNTRKPIFSDIRVRKTLANVMDFCWMNKVYFGGSFVRTKSYFDNSELASKGLPSGEELFLLNQYRDILPDTVFNEEFNLSYFKNREEYRYYVENKALKLLKDAGWKINEKGKLVNNKGEAFYFEILLHDPMMEKVVQSFIKDLKLLGIVARIRLLDTAQYYNRQKNYDFDMIIEHWAQSLSPGNEQFFRWSSKAADSSCTRNYPGIKSKVVDCLCEQMVSAKTRKDLILKVRALDRVLLHGHYVIPFCHDKKIRFAHSNRVVFPEVDPLVGINYLYWWSHTGGNI